jgi:hypothetical protein
MGDMEDMAQEVFTVDFVEASVEVTDTVTITHIITDTDTDTLIHITMDSQVYT